MQAWAYTSYMNTRDYKLFRPGECYHIYNRGDNREEVFLDDMDYASFLKRMKLVLGLLDPAIVKLRLRPLPSNSFTVLSYCLMPNHFHFLIRQEANVPIGELMSKVNTSYAKYFNAKYERVGNIFQDTFKAKHVDSDSYLTYLSAYIHNNPTQPFEYVYSSLPEYLGTRNGNLCNPTFILKYFKGNRNDYRKFVEGYTFKDYQKIKHLAFY